MKTLTINKEKLVEAITSRARATTSWEVCPYVVAINHNDKSPTGWVIGANIPGLTGDHPANLVGEKYYLPEVFVDPTINLTWTVNQEEKNPDLVKLVAHDWVEENLLNHLELGGHLYRLKYV